MIGREQDFRVGLRAEDLTETRQFTPQFEIVVDLAVKDEPEICIGISHRLQTGIAQVDDSEAPVTKRYRARHRAEFPPAMSVGSAMRDHIDSPGVGRKAD